MLGLWLYATLDGVGSGVASFRRKASPQDNLEQARARVRALKAELDADPAQDNRRKVAAQQRARAAPACPLLVGRFARLTGGLPRADTSSYCIATSKALFVPVPAAMG